MSGEGRRPGANGVSRWRELNHILIPSSPDAIERLRRGRLARVARPLLWLARTLTNEGALVAVAMLVAGAAGVDVFYSRLYLIFCGLFGLLTAAFLLRPLARVDGITLAIEHPAQVTAGEPMRFTAVLRNEGDAPRHALRVMGPFLPWDGEWTGARPGVPVLEPGEEARVELAARFGVRGQRDIGRFSVGSVRPLALMMGRRISSAAVRFTVVPRIPEVRGVERLDRGFAGGEAPRAVQKQGLSFELHGVRPYRTGDRIRDLHARSWARAGQPMVREYAMELQPRAGLVIDPRVPGPRARLEAVIELAAGVAAALVRQGRVAVAVCGDDAPALDAGALEGVLHTLAGIEPPGRGAEAGPYHPSVVASRLAAALPRGGLVHLVVGRLDDQAAVLRGAVEGTGHPVRVWVVGPDAPADPMAVHVLPAALTEPVVVAGPAVTGAG